MAGGLNPKQQRFIDEYLIDLNATQAAVRAGYSARTAEAQGSRLLSHVKVKEAVDAAIAARSARTAITADYVLTTIKDTIDRCSGLGESYQPGQVLKGAELLGKHLKMFTDKIEHTGNISVTIVNQ